MSKNLFTEPDDDWTPVLFMETKEGEQGIMPLHEFMGAEPMKDLLANALIPMTINEFKAVKIVMVLSVWSSEKSVQALKEDKYVPPSQQDDREEHVLLVEMTREGVQRHSWAKIIRHKSKPPTLGEWNETTATGFDGRFVDPLVKALKAVSP
jgi:hypothetical protein